ncbi:hypothetical protein O6H91_07G129200 [Diphasiastrum complanatum]|uniref:Uncharacterized protein n=1 Tax=Diphasiastrum complanatum TaxID=34168 RepID=A0ACC2DA20_DIPCM|nr:hypothetical protein O6H91_07G129200 [Diphasiastrum complanatum]
MGRKGRWLSALKNAFRSRSKDSETLESSAARDLKLGGSNADRKKPSKGRRKWSFTRSRHREQQPDHPVASHVEKQSTQADEKQNQHALAVAAATAAAAEAAAAAAQVAAAVARLTGADRRTSFHKGRKTEEWAAIRIQTAFRGYLARRVFRALKGLVRLQALVRGHAVRRQSTTALRCMQTLVKVQGQVRARRIHMAEENKAIQQEFWHKQEEIEPKISEPNINLYNNWDDSAGSLEDIQSRIQSKQEGAMKRERALAYAFAQQLREASSKESTMQNELDKPRWGWSWLERWMAARPYDANIFDKDAPDGLSMRSTESTPTKQVEVDAERKNGSTARLPILSHSRLSTQGVHSSKPSQNTKKFETQTFEQSPATSIQTTNLQLRLSNLQAGMIDEQESAAFTTKNFASTIRSNTVFPHSVVKLGKVANSTSDNDSVASYSSVPGYMATTQSAKAKVRSYSTPKQRPRKDSMVSFKKRLSFPIQDSKAFISSYFPRRAN